jgi:hypothetical protein
METKYQALRIIGAIFKVMAVIVGIFTILAALLTCIGVTSMGPLMDLAASTSGVGAAGLGTGMMAVIGVIYAVMILIMFLPFAVMLFAAGEGIFLLIDLEENTRRTVMLLEGRIVRAEVAPPR